MNILYLRAKLFGRPFRNEDGDGEAGGSMSAGPNWGGPSPKDGPDLAPSTTVELSPEESQAAISEAQSQSNANNVGGWTGADGGSSGWYDSAAGWGMEDPLGQPSSPASPAAPSQVSNKTADEKEAEKEDAVETQAQSIAKGLLGTIQTNPPTSNPYGVNGKPSNAIQAVGNFIDSVKSNWNNAVPQDSRVLSTFVDPQQAAQMRAMGVEPPTKSAQEFVDSYRDPSKSAAANGGVSIPGYSTSGIALKDLQALDQSGYGKFDVSPSQTVSQARGVMDVVDPAIQTGVRVLEMTTPLGTMKNVAKAIDKATKTGNWVDAATEFVGGWATQKAVGMVNSAVLGQLGPVGKAIGNYNRAASMVNAVGGSLPGINPGGMIASSLGIGGKTAASTTLPDGTTPYSPEGFSSGSGDGGASAPTPAPITVTETPKADGAISYGQRFDGAALGKAIREGAANRYRR